MKLFVTILLIASAVSQNAEKIMKESHLAYYYAEKDGKAKVRMTMTDKNGNEKNKEFTMSRLDKKDGGDQFYFIYFRKPSDINKMTFMVHKHNDSDDDRWLYVPAIDLVKQIAASDKSSSFVGSDFSYEDVSGRLWTLDKHELIGNETINSFDVYKVRSTPKSEDYFSYKISYISKENKLPLKEEYYDKNNTVFKRFEILKVEDVSGVATAIKRKMSNLKSRQHTIIEFQNIKYNAGIKEKYFKERYLKKPHRSMK